MMGFLDELPLPASKENIPVRCYIAEIQLMYQGKLILLFLRPLINTDYPNQLLTFSL